MSYFINKQKQYIAFNKTIGSDPGIIFIHGYNSDMSGEKAKYIEKYAKLKKISFVKFDCRGHGKSYGKFEDGSISGWTKDTKKIIKRKISKKKLIVVGSSMGGWIALNLFKEFKKNILAFVGIAPAPEFLDRLMWKKFTNKVKRQLIKDKFHKFNHGGYEYNISYNLIKDGRKNKIFNKNFSNKIFLTILHGLKDDVVPISISRKILKIFTKAKKKLIIIKQGNHSLSNKGNLKRIRNEIYTIYKQLRP